MGTIALSIVGLGVSAFGSRDSSRGAVGGAASGSLIGAAVGGVGGTIDSALFGITIGAALCAVIGSRVGEKALQNGFSGAFLGTILGVIVGVIVGENANLIALVGVIIGAIGGAVLGNSKTRRNTETKTQSDDILKSVKTQSSDEKELLIVIRAASHVISAAAFVGSHVGLVKGVSDEAYITTVESAIGMTRNAIAIANRLGTSNADSLLKSSRIQALIELDESMNDAIHLHLIRTLKKDSSVSTQEELLRVLRNEENSATFDDAQRKMNAAFEDTRFRAHLSDIESAVQEALSHKTRVSAAISVIDIIYDSTNFNTYDGHNVENLSLSYRYGKIAGIEGELAASVVAIIEDSRNELRYNILERSN